MINISGTMYRIQSLAATFVAVHIHVDMSSRFNSFLTAAKVGGCKATLNLVGSRLHGLVDLLLPCLREVRCNSNNSGHMNSASCHSLIDEARQLVLLVYQPRACPHYRAFTSL